MKKKCIAALVLTVALASQPVWAFAANSPTSNGSIGSSSSSDGSGSIGSSSSNKGTTSTNSNTTVTVSATGVKTTGATTSASQTGSTIGVAVDHFENTLKSKSFLP